MIQIHVITDKGRASGILSSKAESAQGDLNSQSGTSPCVRHLHLPFREQKIDLVFLNTGDDADTTLFILLPSGYSTQEIKSKF